MMAGPIQWVCAATTVNTRRAPAMQSRAGTLRASRRPQLGFCAVLVEVSHDLAHRIAKPLGGKQVPSLCRLTAQFTFQGRVLNGLRDSFAGILHRVES